MKSRLYPILSFVIAAGLVLSSAPFPLSPAVALASAPPMPVRAIGFDNQTPGSAPDIPGFTVEENSDYTVSVANAPAGLYYATVSDPANLLSVSRKVLRVARTGGTDGSDSSRVMEWALGVLPENFNFGFSFYYTNEVTSAYPQINLDLVTGESSARAMTLKSYGATYYVVRGDAGVNTADRMTSVSNARDTWTRFMFNINRGAGRMSANVNGGLELTYSNPSTNATNQKDIGALFDGLDFTQEAKLRITVITQEKNQSTYFDDFIAYGAENYPKTYNFDFQNNIPGGFAGNPSLYPYYQIASLKIGQTTSYYNLARYSLLAAQDPDPAKPENIVLQGKRGTGGSVGAFKGTAAIVVQKPKTDFTLAFKTRVDNTTTGGTYVYAVNGANPIVASADARTNPGNASALWINTANGAQIFGMPKSGTGFAVHGGNSGDNLNLIPVKSMDTWVDVKMIYDFIAGTYSYVVDGVEQAGASVAANSALEKLRTVLTSAQNAADPNMTLIFKNGRVLLDTGVDADGKDTGASEEPKGEWYLDDIKITVDGLNEFKVLAYDDTSEGVTVSAQIGQGGLFADGALAISAVYASDGALLSVNFSEVSRANPTASLPLLISASEKTKGYSVSSYIWAKDIETVTPLLPAVKKVFAPAP